MKQTHFDILSDWWSRCHISSVACHLYSELIFFSKNFYKLSIKQRKKYKLWQAALNMTKIIIINCVLYFFSQNPSNKTEACAVLIKRLLAALVVGRLLQNNHNTSTKFLSPDRMTRASPSSFYQLAIKIESEYSNCFSRNLWRRNNRTTILFFGKQLLNSLKQPF